MMDQPPLIEGVRLDPPDCYDDVIAALETVTDNQPQVTQWDADRLAHDIWLHGMLDPKPEIGDVERAVRIYRERNAT